MSHDDFAEFTDGVLKHIPIYGYCGLPLNERCDDFRACYTCPWFIGTPGKLPLYIQTRDELRTKEARAREIGESVLSKQFKTQANHLDRIIARVAENYDS